MINKKQRYRKKSNQNVTAVQLDLETDGFSYNKWGSIQRCKQGDWLVNNNGETYTIDKYVFKKTYQKVSTGIYMKSSEVWAEVAHGEVSNTIEEGKPPHEFDDYIVSNDESGTDKYYVSRKKFESMYEPT